MGALLDQGFSRMGVAPRPPSSVMAAAPPAPRRNAPAARPVAQGNARAAQVASSQRRAPQQQTAAAPNRQNMAPVTYRQPPTPPRPAARPVQRVEQGSATSNTARPNTQRSSAQTQQLRAPPRPTQR
jgi:hypothetical protein